MKRYQPISLLDAIIDYSARNPGVVLSASYVLLTLCGIFDEPGHEN
jgi:hypothetical protein